MPMPRKLPNKPKLARGSVRPPFPKPTNPKRPVTRRVVDGSLRKSSEFANKSKIVKFGLGLFGRK